MNNPISSPTAAAARRKPFSVSNGKETTHVHCCHHTLEVATFYCARCMKPCGECCVGYEEDEQTVCSACMTGEQEKELRQSLRKHRRRKIFLATVCAAVCVVLGVNAYVLMRYLPASEAAQPPAISSQLSALVECRHRLEQVAYQADIFRQTLGRAPENLDEIASFFDDPAKLHEPVTGAAYLLAQDASGKMRAVCPHPEGHGLKSLSALAGSPAQMEYMP